MYLVQMSRSDGALVKNNSLLASTLLVLALVAASSLPGCAAEEGGVAPDAPERIPPSEARDAGSDGRQDETSQGDAGADSGTAPVLAPVVAALANEVATRSPGTELGLAVYDFTTKEYAGVNDEVAHISASSAKAIWVAAALKKVGIAPVAPHAVPIFETSSNEAATEVIKLAGPNYINELYALAKMEKSAYTQWAGGNVATNSPKLLGNDNYFTAKDAVSFLKGVQQGTLLDATLGAKLNEWMTLSPRAGFGGWLGTLLPASARASLRHKAGWLPPPYDARCVNEIGLVEAGAGHWYAIAILARSAADYEAEQDFVEHASCAVFKAAASMADLDCK